MINGTPDEFLEDEARATAHIPPEPIPDAAGLPDDVREDRIEDEAPDAPVMPKED